MKTNILKKLAFRFGTLAFATAMVGCDALDLAPIDSYGSGNFWTRKEHVIAYMDGLHKNFRDQIFQQQFVMGEARGGCCIPDVAVDGTSVSYQSIITQQLNAQSPGMSKFGNIYGCVANVNIFLQKTKEATYMTDDEKAYYLAQAYGLRAFYYFGLYKTYGTAPLRLDPNPVVNGDFNPNNLYMKRSSGADLMKQIKEDIQSSLDHFGENNSFDPFNRKNLKSYWSKAATEYLAAEVYLWNAKVSVDNNEANLSDLSIAKQHLNNLISNYNLSLMPNYTDVFNSNQKGNAEVIFAVRYMEGEASNPFTAFMYNYQTGAFKTVGYNDENGKLMGDTLRVSTTGMQRIEYLPQFYLSYDKTDSRRDATFLGAYSRKDNSLAGTVYKKIMGHFDETINRYIWDADIITYRLAGVYLMMAEVANMEGRDVAPYINKIRERAYGKNWDANKYGYTNGNFTENELAILHEKDKEMLGEGQRWYDLKRMTLTKGGKHLVFCPEAGIDGKAVLNESESHKLFWPLETEMLTKDPELTQTPGYK